MLSYHGERVRSNRRRDLVGGSVPLGMGFEISKAYARPRISLPRDQGVTLSYCPSACLNATILPIVLMMN